MVANISKVFLAEDKNIFSWAKQNKNEIFFSGFDITHKTKSISLAQITMPIELKTISNSIKWYGKVEHEFLYFTAMWNSMISRKTFTIIIHRVCRKRTAFMPVDRRSSFSCNRTLSNDMRRFSVHNKFPLKWYVLVSSKKRNEWKNAYDKLLILNALTLSQTDSMKAMNWFTPVVLICYIIKLY